MNRFVGPLAAVSFFLALTAAWSPAAEPEAAPELRAGIIGLDTSHAIAFTRLLNAEKPQEALAGCRIVAAYPKGSPDIQSSVSRVPKYTEEIQQLGVEIVDSIDELIQRVDVVLLETNDGRPHLEQALPVLKARKPMFIDKPIAGSLADAVAIFEAARKYGTPVWSSSSLRYTEGAQALRNGAIGDILGCDAYSPCSLEPTHPDLYWYGIHGVESLFTVMGTGCESVVRVHAPGTDIAVGRWSGDRWARSAASAAARAATAARPSARAASNRSAPTAATARWWLKSSSSSERASRRSANRKRWKSTLL
jgi:hypothetical protein